MKPTNPAACTRAVLYARVSSKDQEKEGFSIPAQQRLLREHAATHGLTITQEFLDVETARRAGRTAFGELLIYLKKHPRTILLCEKTDRLYRNIKDWATLDEVGVTIHFVKENVIISPDAKSTDQFLHGIKVLMARNYSQNLGEETLKGMTEKARAGIYPSAAPTGYQNVDGPDGKRIITPHPTEAPVITELFTVFATGKYSLKGLAAYARERGILLGGRKVYVSALHHILRRKLYNGSFDFNGTTYQGTHKPLTTKETWDSVQRLLDQRKEHQTKGTKRDFPFTGLVTCGHCGCAMVAELKTKKKTKRTYVYYHCTGHRGKCPEPYTRQETLVNDFASTLGDLVIPPEILDWLATEVNQTDQTQTGARDATIKRLDAEKAKLQHRLSTLYDDRLDGTITKTTYDEKARTLNAQQEEVERKLTAARETAQVPLTTALDLMRLTSTACTTFRDQNEAAQRELLTTVLKEATWKDGTLRTTLLEPFEQLRRSNSVSANGINGNGGSGRCFEDWLLR